MRQRARVPCLRAGRPDGLAIAFQPYGVKRASSTGGQHAHTPTRPRSHRPVGHAPGRVELQEDGSRWSATAKVHLDLDLDRAELERLRWYLEYPIDPAPKIAAQVEQRLVELGRDLFGQVFQVREATRLWDRAEPGQDQRSADGRPSRDHRASALMARIGPNPVEPATTGRRAGQADGGCALSPPLPDPGYVRCMVLPWDRLLSIG